MLGDRRVRLSRRDARVAGSLFLRGLLFGQGVGRAPSGGRKRRDFGLHRPLRDRRGTHLLRRGRIRRGLLCRPQREHSAAWQAVREIARGVRFDVWIDVRID